MKLISKSGYKGAEICKNKKFFGECSEPGKE